MATLTQRPATNADLDLIYSIIRQSLRRYIEQIWGPWNEAEQCARFDALTRSEDHHILELDGQPIGCMSLKESETEIYLARLLIVPQFQNRGIGSRLLRDVLASADEKGLPVHLRVMKVNPARRLYERHDFVVTEASETHYMMVRAAAGR